MTIRSIQRSMQERQASTMTIDPAADAAAADWASPRAHGEPAIADDGPPTLHFRRIYTPLSETFIREPIGQMLAMGVRVRGLSLIRAVAQDKPVHVNSLVPFRGVLRKAPRLRRKVMVNVGHSDPDTLIWPLVRPLLLAHAWMIRPRLIHAHFGPDGCLIAPVARWLGVPLIVSFYGYDVSRIIKADRERWAGRYARVFEQAAALVAISQHIASKLVELGAPPEKIRVIPLGIRLERFAGLAAQRAARPVEHGEGGQPVVRCLHVGRLTAKKDPEGMIRSFALARELAGGRVDLRLDVVGDGPLREACHALAESCGHGRAIRFHGSVGHDRIPELLVQADIYTQHCVTAPDGDMEGLGVTFMEGSAAGLPIVGTLHDGIPEVVADGVTGLLVPERDYRAMAERMVELALDPARRLQMGQAGIERAAERFTMPLMIQRTLRLHAEVLAAHAAKRG
jgi:glycosyltransferase involved in cell wall biosynthesis